MNTSQSLDAIIRRMIEVSEQAGTSVSAGLFIEAAVDAVCAQDGFFSDDEEKRELSSALRQLSGTASTLREYGTALMRHRELYAREEDKKRGFLSLLHGWALAVRQAERNEEAELTPCALLKVISEMPSVSRGIPDSLDAAQGAAPSGGITEFLDELDFPPCEESAELCPEASKETITALTDRAEKIRRSLSASVFGQENAIDTFIKGYFQAELAAAVRQPGKRPKSMFLFAGPPGVGKTYLARRIAEELKLPFMRFDMSEYADKESHLEFCGFDRAYRGSSEGNVTGFVRENPSSVLLFDEIEKAHPVVIHLFLQMLDAGRLRDNYTDLEVSFTDTIVIFTTNAGARLYDESETSSLSSVSGKVVLNALKNDVDRSGAPFFPAALCSRFAAGNVVMFNHLDSQVLLRIAENEVQKQIRLFENHFQIGIVTDEKLSSALLFSEGGTADGRTIVNKARSFVTDELFELFRLITASEPEGSIGRLEKVTVSVSLNTRDPDIMSLFTPDGHSDILVFASEQAAAIYREQAPSIHFVDAQSFSEAKRKLKNHNVDFILIDMGYGISGKQIYLNFEDVKSKARDFLMAVRGQLPDIPVYLLTSGEISLSDEEKASYLRHGVRGILPFDGNFAGELAEALRRTHRQNCMTRLAKSNKLLDFETAQTLNRDRTRAEIRLFDFRLSVAVDAEDAGNILSAVHKPDVSFDQVIGAEDAKKELRLFVKYLQNPRKYLGTGLKAPRGVLFYGPPGTGKTMLAKALAKESDVAFIAAEGNSFLKKYVGEGAKKVHELFRTARKYAPSILFIDEIDAIAKARTGDGSSSGAEEILTALLAEMDGFASNPSKPVFVLAATNLDADASPDSGRAPDSALIRRFDRRIYVGLPNREDRIRFFHLRFEENKAFQVSRHTVESLAVRSTGMSLAELSSALDFSLRTAIMEDKLKVTDDVLEKAFESYRFGDAKKQTTEQLTRSARHESGHALLCFLSGRTPSYVTIVSRGGHGGYVQHADSEERTYYTKEELLSQIRILLGGRAAEVVYYGEEQGITTTSSADMAAASRLAEKIICTYSMDETFGLRTLEAGTPVSEALALRIHERVNFLLTGQMRQAVALIKENKPAIDRLACELLLRNRLIGSEIEALLSVFRDGCDPHL